MKKCIEFIDVVLTVERPREKLDIRYANMVFNAFFYYKWTYNYITSINAVNLLDAIEILLTEITDKVTKTETFSLSEKEKIYLRGEIAKAYQNDNWDRTYD